MNPLLTWRRLYARPVWTSEDVQRAREAGRAAVPLTVPWSETQEGVDALSASLAASIRWVPYWRQLPPDSWGDWPRA